MEIVYALFTGAWLSAAAWAAYTHLKNSFKQTEDKQEAQDK